MRYNIVYDYILLFEMKKKKCLFIEYNGNSTV